MSRTADRPRPTKASERRYARLVRALQEASAAMDAVLAEEPAVQIDDGRIRLKRDIDEYAGYLERATWWRARG